MSVACDPQVVVSKGGAITVECKACNVSLVATGHVDARWMAERHIEETIRKLREKTTS